VPERATAGSLSFDAVADGYDRTVGGMARGREMAAALAAQLAPGIVVEIGVGTGLVASALAERGRTVLGVDVSRPMLARARQRLGGAVALGDAQALPLASRSVGNGVLVNVLHLVADMGAALREAARVLVPGGRVLALHGSPIPVPTDLTEAMAPLEALQRRPDGPEAVVEAGRRCRLELVEQGLAAPYGRDLTPHEMAETIEQRRFSYLMRLDDRTWAEVVRPVLEAVRSLPEQSRPRRQRWRTHLTVLRRDRG
jgi:SAM-dependent methyltransferase